MVAGGSRWQYVGGSKWQQVAVRGLMNNTGRHTVTFRVLKVDEGPSRGWAVVGMASPESGKGTGPGGSDDSVGVGSDGTSSVGPSNARIQKVWLVSELISNNRTHQAR